MSKTMRYMMYAAAVPRNILVRKRLRPLPIDLFNYEVTRRCNGRCIYCNIWREQVKDELTGQELEKGLRPRSLFEKTHVVALTGGEPILRPDLLDIITKLHEVCPRARFAIVTNGLVPEKFLQTVLEAQRIVTSPLMIMISLDGFPESDGTQRGNKTHSQLAWETHLRLKENGIESGFGSTLTKLNMKEMSRFRDWLWKQGISQTYTIASKSEHYYNNVGDNSFQPLDPSDSDALRTIGKTGSGNSDFEHYLPSYLENPRQLFPCFSGFSSFFLNSQGNIYPCIHLGESFGNIKDTPFGQLWNSANAKLIRKAIVEKKCHCWAGCEANNTIRQLLYPALLRMLRQ